MTGPNPLLGLALLRAQRRLLAAQADLARVHEAPAVQQRAELLKTVAGKVRRFDKEVVAIDYGSVPPTKVAIALLPGVPIVQQIDKLFRTARRLTAAEARVTARITSIEEQIATISAAMVDAALAASNDREAILERYPTLATLLPAPPKARHQAAPEPLPYRQYVSSAGKPIWVGKGASKNDALTFKHASPHAYWLHATGFSGAHVVVPAQRDERLDARTLDEAARLAAHFSKAPEGFVEVAVTRVKFVKKPRGAKAGLVSIAREECYRLDNQATVAIAITKSGERSAD